jgi:hypothetical protein
MPTLGFRRTNYSLVGYHVNGSYSLAKSVVKAFIHEAESQGFQPAAAMSECPMKAFLSSRGADTFHRVGLL